MSLPVSNLDGPDRQHVSVGVYWFLRLLALPCHPFSLLTLKVKHLIPLFRSPVLSSAPIKCGCSTRIEALQRRQCQDWERGERGKGGEGERGTGLWLQPVLRVFPTETCDLCCSSGVFFINQFCCCLLTRAQCVPLFALTNGISQLVIGKQTWALLYHRSHGALPDCS